MTFQGLNFLSWFPSKKNMIFEFEFFYFSNSVEFHDEKNFQKSINISLVKVPKDDWSSVYLFRT